LKETLQKLPSLQHLTLFGLSAAGLGLRGRGRGGGGIEAGKVTDVGMSCLKQGIENLTFLKHISLDIN